jgi:phosphotransferase system HPr-like phosphotransfer protein
MDWESHMKRWRSQLGIHARAEEPVHSECSKFPKDLDVALHAVLGASNGESVKAIGNGRFPVVG